ncbi:hypothetical protein [Arthrobacter sp. CAN_A1]|uniref:hypothetical protein n=1 Tax=Arthrobacter sp. CAN_A1 TaxID=2787717 RepID=UPI0018CBC987
MSDERWPDIARYFMDEMGFTEAGAQNEAIAATEPFEERHRLANHEYQVIDEQSNRPHHFSSRYEVWRNDLLIRSEQHEGRSNSKAHQDVINQVRGLRLVASSNLPNVVVIRRP